MDILVTYLAVILACGVLAWAIKLPPLIGFLAAGFALNALGVEHIESLDLFADLGVTLMLFAIGLRLDLKALADKSVWFTAGSHMVIMTIIGTGFILGIGALGAFGPTNWSVAVNIALVLSFSSTIVVIKILQERGDEQALYGNICIGVLIMQDIAAVVFMSVLRGEPPKIASLSLVLIIPALMLVTRRWYKLGHGELGALFGIAMALIPGYALFEWCGLSGSLGALIMGLVLSRTPGAEQLSHSLFTLKELLLVGFFVNIGFMGIPPLGSRYRRCAAVLAASYPGGRLLGRTVGTRTAQPHQRADVFASLQLLRILADHRGDGCGSGLADQRLDADARHGGVHKLRHVRDRQSAECFSSDTPGKAPTYSPAIQDPPR